MTYLTTGKTVKTKNGEITSIHKTGILGVKDSVCISENGKEKVYFGDKSINAQMAEIEEFDNKIGLMVDGPISYFGLELTAHKNLSNQFKDHLLNKRGFSEVNLVTINPLSGMQSFFNKLKTPKTLGFLKIVCHGNQTGSSDELDNTDEFMEFGNIFDHQISTMINDIDPTSFVIIFSDVCFSDGLIDKKKITSDARYVYFSAARESGNSSDTSALYFYGGGYLTYHLLNFMMLHDAFSIEELYKKIINDQTIYYDDKGANNHHPRIIYNNEISIHKALLL